MKEYDWIFLLLFIQSIEYEYIIHTPLHNVLYLLFWKVSLFIFWILSRILNRILIVILIREGWFLRSLSIRLGQDLQTKLSTNITDLEVF